MKALIQRLLAPVLIAVLLAALLSTVPMMVETWNSQQAVNVFQPDSFQKLTPERVADHLLSHPLQIRVIRVDWDQPTFFVELIQPPSVSEESMAKEIYQLTRHSLVGMENIQEVRLVIHRDEQSSWLLVAKKDQLQNDPDMLNQGQLSYKEYLGQMFDLKIIPTPDTNR
ncbi:hypothetical protein [Hazenella coriacea]|uniref:Uncharacterized protein n=1 Tax=Hazenella coriacea TaxID=1179467 RepID=A0A4R3L1F8_9BACL|nr:hypothetical protein [Hazenella coriacea]TCS93401.1 hypothetical protein EDD58_10747 [Hazenella coriacea]